MVAAAVLAASITCSSFPLAAMDAAVQLARQDLGRADAAHLPPPPAAAAPEDAQLVSWPATVPTATLQEVDRLIGRRFSVKHCIREGDGSGCPADALWIQFQARPAGWRALAVADRSLNLIGIFPDAVLEHARLYPKDVWFHIALGRIAAHEIVHLLVRDRDHWGNGLMKSHQSREQLTALRLLPLED